MTILLRQMTALLLKVLVALGIVGAAWAGLNIYAQTVQPPVSSDGGAVPDRAEPLPQWASGTEPPAWPSSAAPEPEVSGPVQVLYPERPQLGESVGTLSIPALKTKLPIIEGTEDDQLKQGVGHFVQSVLPGERDNCVLSGHRDTVFGELGALEIGDRFVVRTAAGTFTYAISRIRIVDKDDKTVIVPTDHSVLTVTTCYPFRYIGSAPDRYILVADLLEP